MVATSERDLEPPGPLAGKIGLVLGIANAHSIAAGCAPHLSSDH